MIPADLIRQKRDGHELTDDQIQYFVRRFAAGKIPDYQMSAFAMAVYFRGMTDGETTSLTRHMLESGSKLSWATDAPKVDKHSTGGIGDKVSIVLAPMLAACGLQVPMISGRGLGPTGGTLDKLEAIPGFRTNLNLSEIESLVETIGCVITGATNDICPADRKLYALRDVTATVESVPLITASIMSKKLAESLDSLVLDVKFGSGSFMQTADQAAVLARSLVRVGTEMELQTRALLTDMNQPLGRMVGNAVEIAESIDCLQGGGPSDLRQLVIALGSPLLQHSLHVTDRAACEELARKLDGGQAYEKFVEMVAAQGGDIFSLTKRAARSTIVAGESGFIQSINGREIGNAIITLGGGRKFATDSVDHSVGIEMLVRVGDEVEQAQPILQVFAENDDAAGVAESLRAAIVIGNSPVESPLLVVQEIGRTV